MDTSANRELRQGSSTFVWYAVLVTVVEIATFFGTGAFYDMSGASGPGSWESAWFVGCTVGLAAGLIGGLAIKRSPLSSRFWWTASVSAGVLAVLTLALSAAVAALPTSGPDAVGSTGLGERVAGAFSYLGVWGFAVPLALAAGLGISRWATTDG